ncbi:MAG TPA: Vms1/Ankzf1 family peptidyl-tRNA hydrolase, partial [Solirubrobacteraceae bacterium]|nr:Vms1/Ankzf1 family peptidyl-tRNA hydrolase [Solirubrobacteraceae bacterium]
MQVNEIDIGRLQRLAAWRPQGTPVTSVYVDLDPTGFATAPARATQISSLLADAEHAAERLAAGHAGRASARRDVEALRAFFAGADFEPKGAHGLAVFCSTDAGLFEVLRLPEPVEPAAVVDERPWLEPLIGHERARRCLALVSRRTLRAFADDRDGPLLEQADLADDVHGRHDQGGWSQSRYQRGIEHEVDEHLKRCAEALLALLHRTRYDVLAIGATPELYGRVEAALDPRVRERLIGRFDVDVEQANADEAL